MGVIKGLLAIMSLTIYWCELASSVIGFEAVKKYFLRRGREYRQVKWCNTSVSFVKPLELKLIVNRLTNYMKHIFQSGNKQIIINLRLSETHMQVEMRLKTTLSASLSGRYWSLNIAFV